MSLTLKLLTVMVLAANASCTGNALSEFADPTTDEALLFEAKKLMNKSQWTEALTKFSEMSAAFLAKREIKLKHAEVFAGLCGLDFLGLVESLGSNPNNLFLMLEQSYPGATAATVQGCIDAESKVKEISAIAVNRTVDENLLMAFVGFSKMGAILNLYADVNNDAVLDWGNDDSCLVGNLPDDEAKHVATGMTNALASLAAAAVGGSTIGAGATGDLTVICGLPGVTFCNDVEITDIDAAETLAIRTLIQADESIGLATCTDGTKTFADCTCI